VALSLLPNGRGGIRTQLLDFLRAVSESNPFSGSRRRRRQHLWFPRLTLGPFKSLPLYEEDLASLDDGTHLSRALVDGICHWLLPRLRRVLPTDGGLRLLVSTVADKAHRAARGDFDSASRGVEAMRRNSVFFACMTVLPYMSGSSWSAVIIHGLNAIVPHVRHAMGLEVAPANAATAAEMVVIFSQQDENASCDVAYINEIYRILATTFAYVHMKVGSAPKTTLAVELVLRRVLPVVVRRLPDPTKSFRAGKNLISYLAFYMSAHPTGAARLRSTDKLWTQSAPLAKARQAVSDLVTAQRRRDDAVENNVAAVLLCKANLHGENYTSGDDDASGGTPPPPPKPDNGKDAGSGRLRDSGSSVGTSRSDRGDKHRRDSGGQGGGGVGGSPKAGARQVRKERIGDTSRRRAKVMAVGGSFTVPGGRDGGGLEYFNSRGSRSGMSAAMALTRLDHKVSAAAHSLKAAARFSGENYLLLPRRMCTTPPHGPAITHEATSGRSSLRAVFVFFRGAARGFPSNAPAAGLSAVTLTFRSHASPMERCASASARFQGSTIMETAAYSDRKNKEPLAPTLVAARESTVASDIFGSQAAQKPLHCTPLVGLHRGNEAEHHGCEYLHAHEDQDEAKNRGEWDHPGPQLLFNQRFRAPDDGEDCGDGPSSTRKMFEASSSTTCSTRYDAFMTASTENDTTASSSTSLTHRRNSTSESDSGCNSSTRRFLLCIGSGTVTPAGTESLSSGGGSRIATGYRWVEGTYIRGGQPAAGLRRRLRALEPTLLLDPLPRHSEETFAAQARGESRNNNTVSHDSAPGDATEDFSSNHSRLCSGSADEVSVVSAEEATSIYNGVTLESSSVDTDEATHLLSQVHSPQGPIFATASTVRTAEPASHRARRYDDIHRR